MMADPQLGVDQCAAAPAQLVVAVPPLVGADREKKRGTGDTGAL